METTRSEQEAADSPSEAAGESSEALAPARQKTPLALHMEAELLRREQLRELQALDDLRVAQSTPPIGRNGWFPSTDVNGEAVNSVGPDGQPRGQGEYPKNDSRTGAQSARCKASRADGMRCILWALAPTDYCSMHGGLYQRAQLLAENKYAKLLNGSRRLRDLFVDLCSSPDLTDLRPVLALQQAMLADVLEGLTGSDLGQLSAQAVSGITQLNLTIAKLTETVVAVEGKAPTSITAHQVLWLMEQLVTIVCNVVTKALPSDELADVRTEIIEGIAFGLEEIAIANPRGGAAFPGFYDKDIRRPPVTDR